jgi:hypothetical protein
MDTIKNHIFIGHVIKPAVKAFDSGLSPDEIEQVAFLVPSFIHEYALAQFDSPFQSAIELAASYVLGLRDPDQYLGDRIKTLVSAMPRCAAKSEKNK